MDLIKIKHFCFSEVTIKKPKRQATVQNLQNICDKKICNKIYKELLKLNINKSHNLKMGRFQDISQKKM